MLHYAICFSPVRETLTSVSPCFYRLKQVQIATIFVSGAANLGTLTSTGQRQSSGFPDFQSAVGDSVWGWSATHQPATVNLEEQRRLVTSIQHDRWATPNYCAPVTRHNWGPAKVKCRTMQKKWTAEEIKTFYINQILNSSLLIVKMWEKLCISVPGMCVLCLLLQCVWICTEITSSDVLHVLASADGHIPWTSRLNGCPTLPLSPCLPPPSSLCGG